jgi:cardiolipin synthase
MANSCKKIEAEDLNEIHAWRQVRSFFLFHFLRRFPTWAGWLPAHAPRLRSLQPSPTQEGADRLTETPYP